MRWIIATAFLLLTATAQAQTPLTGTTGAPGSVTPPNAAPPAAGQVAPASPAPAAHARKPRRTLQERFDEANTTHDGHLTAEQARAGLPSVARDFDAIDTTHKGYVTIDDIKAHRAAVRAAHRAAKQKS
jgi:hypothetical protein